MAPIDPSFFNIVARYSPLAFEIIQIGAVVWVAVSCVITIVYAYRALPVSQRVRALERPRRNDILILSFLAVLSFLLHLHHSIDYYIDSYGTWYQNVDRMVHTKDVWSSPLLLYSNPTIEGFLQYFGIRRAKLENQGDALLSYVSSSRDYWWTQQRFTAFIIWSVFVTIESNRRNIPKETALKVVALTSPMGLACAQNIFNILLLVTPVPLPDTSKSHNSKPKTWTIRPEVHSFALGLACLFYLSLPSLIHTEYFKYLAILCPLIMVGPLLITWLRHTPRSWGITYRSALEAHRIHLQTFRYLSLTSFVMQCVSTAAAINSEAPLSPMRVRNAVWITDSNSQSPWSALAQTCMQVLKTLLATVSDNPLVSQVAWDVLLTALNLCAWVMIRGLRPRDLYAATWLSWLSNEDVPAPKPTHRRARARQSKGLRSKKRPSHADSDDDYVDEDPDAEYVPPSSVENDAAIVEYEEEGERNHETAVDHSESMGLAWALLAFGGLGFGGASIWGADAISR